MLKVGTARKREYSSSSDHRDIVIWGSFRVGDIYPAHTNAYAGWRSASCLGTYSNEVPSMQVIDQSHMGKVKE